MDERPLFGAHRACPCSPSSAFPVITSQARRVVAAVLGPGDRAHRAFPSSASSVAAARQFVDDALGTWGIGADAQTALLLASELITNAVEHARTVCCVTVADCGAYVSVEVGDGLTTPPPRTGPMPEGEKGRGLLLVAALADDWGWWPTPSGKVVWGTTRVDAEAGAPTSRPGGGRGRSGAAQIVRAIGAAALDPRRSALCSAGLHNRCTHWDGEAEQHHATVVVCRCRCHTACPMTSVSRAGRVSSGAWPASCTCPRTVSLRPPGDSVNDDHGEG